MNAHQRRQDRRRVTRRTEGIHPDALPAKCPITGRPYFMTLDHPELGMVPTYGGPYDSYTIPHAQGEASQPWHERELVQRRYDHDAGGWLLDVVEAIPLRIIHDEVREKLEDAEQTLQALGYVYDGLHWKAPHGVKVVPAGYKLVPIEPTQEMVDAGDAEAPEPWRSGFAREMWKAMLDAADGAPPSSEPTWQDKVMERHAFQRGVSGMRDCAIHVIRARHESGHDCSPAALAKAIREATDPTDPCGVLAPVQERPVGASTETCGLCLGAGWLFTGESTADSVEPSRGGES